MYGGRAIRPVSMMLLRIGRYFFAVIYNIGVPIQNNNNNNNNAHHSSKNKIKEAV
jgi:hypothetical protein